MVARLDFQPIAESNQAICVASAFTCHYSLWKEFWPAIRLIAKLLHELLSNELQERFEVLERIRRLRRTRITSIRLSRQDGGILSFSCGWRGCMQLAGRMVPFLASHVAGVAVCSSQA